MATKDFFQRQIQFRELLDRRKRAIVTVEDALMHIKCRVPSSSPDFPVVERQCYFAVYPFTISTSRSDHKYQFEIGNDYYKNPTKQVNVHAREFGEVIRSPSFPSLSPAALLSLDLYLHMSDLSRYDCIEIILYMSIEPGEVLTNEEIKKSTASTLLGVDSKIINDGNPGFISAISGRCSITSGKAFPPSGGRRHVFLRPALDELYGRELCLGSYILATADIKYYFTFSIFHNCPFF